ncbi:hypothetical protein A2U01_0119376, partial [Trifolium medium]|nr:hypothetical protein [Trifolium medium]
AEVAEEGGMNDDGAAGVDMQDEGSDESASV